MARKPRIEYPGASYHVVSRGNQRNKVFINDVDYKDYLNRLWKYHDKIDFIIYAYCLMPNHIHLLIEKEIGKYFQKGEAAMAHRSRVVEESLRESSKLRKRVNYISETLTEGKRVKACKY